MVIYPRKQLDFSFSDLFKAIGFTFNPLQKKENIVTSLRKLWSQDKTIISLSLRTTFDALLIHKNFKSGSEVIVTGINIPDMTQIIHSHGLKNVPIDIDMKSLQLDYNSILNSVSDKTVMIVVAHLFGTIMNIEKIFNLKKNRPDVFIFEDCAQAFSGLDNYLGDSRSDLSVFSFGSIKTASAIGCSIGTVKDIGLLKSLNKILTNYNIQKRSFFFIKLTKYLFLKFLSIPFVYGKFIKLCFILGLDFDKIIVSGVRGFNPKKLLESIRNQPSIPQLEFLNYRLSTIRPDHINNRIEAGKFVKNKLRSDYNVYGSKNKSHTYWLFPIMSNNKKELVKVLLDNGFDATFTSTQLKPVFSDLTHCENPNNCVKYMSKTIYLPVYEGIPKLRLNCMIEIINNFSIKE